ncbi:hypothetical protein IEE91_03230 [Kocuria sp. cx-455]|uniref:hypothetical protein n=1 Tax=Kocuria sp. cx-455 TaxID=2771377 RepID=UPI001687E02B|nr:hypothetical protein [Kocuria sp. cx-455]MBD2764223.1 hypothetical protein [Kocuria sp. cx-455]
MDQYAAAAAEDTSQLVSPSVPAAGRVVVRTLPACAVVVVGIPVVGWFLPRSSAGRGTPWELLVFIAALGLFWLVHWFTRAPRPRFDREVDKAQWKRTLASAARSRSLPSLPDVRIATGVVACNLIEGFMMGAAVLLGALLAQFVRPDLSWLAPSAGALGLAIGYSFQLRRSWRYLRALHARTEAK